MRSSKPKPTVSISSAEKRADGVARVRLSCKATNRPRGECDTLSYVHHGLRHSSILTRSLLLIGLIAAPLAALADAPTTKPALHGSLTTEQGVRVLRVWGTPREQGYAHGYLMGENLRQFLEGLLFDSGLIPDPAAYESTLRGEITETFVLSPDHQAELDGILAGMIDKCGAENCRLKKLDRTIDAVDLLALNTLADWAPGACSSFAAWGSKTEGGETIVARNLDYMKLPGIDSEHLIIARLEPGKERKAWVSIAWPGLIGAYSAISEAGTVVAMHDAPGVRAVGKNGLVPRSVVLREIVETASGKNTLDTAQEILTDTATFRGNNFMIAGPSSIGDTPAAVFEYDGNSSLSSYVTRRSPGDSINQTPPDAICCTNHYRTRGTVQECWRYQVISETLSSWPSDKQLDVSAARDLIAKAAVSTTIHSFVAKPDAGEIWISFCDKTTNACQNKPARFELVSLLKRSGDH